MDSDTFDGIVRSLTRSRRFILSGPLALAFAVTGLIPPDVAARGKSKSKPKPKPNKYGCLDVGDPCGRSTQCCSSVCKGKPGKKTCRAHDESICTPRKNYCTSGVVAQCSTDGLSACYLTTGKAAFCGYHQLGSWECRRCSRDTQCQEEFGPGAACIVLAGICAETCPDTGGTACMASGA